MFVTAGPVMAAPGFTPSFRVAGAAGTPVMAPDGTVAFPTFATVEGTPRTAVQLRPAGGPLADLQVLDPTGVGTVPSIAAGGDGRIVAAWVDAGDVEVATLMPGATTFAPTATLTDDTAEGAAVKVDGAGNAYVIWTTRDDVNPGLQRQVRVRITTLPAGGGAPSTELNETFMTASAVHPTLGIAFDVNDAGDMVFVKQRGTFDPGTMTTTLAYEGWTRPAGGSATAVTPLVTISYSGNVDSNGESTVTSLNVDINEAGAVMASWYRYAFTTLDSVDVVNGTAASGFGSISNPTLGGHLARTTVTSVLDSGGRTTVAVLIEEAGTNKLRTHVFTRSPAGVWSSGQKPMPTGDHNYGNELAADRNGRVMLVFQVTAATATVYTAIAEPDQVFGTPQPLASALTSLQRAIPAFGPSGDGVVAWVFDGGTGDFVTDAAGYDVSPPALRSLTIPTSGTAGSPLAFSVQPFDIWSPVTTAWSFGDGTTGDGPSVSHTYADAGDKAVSVTATDSFGNASSSGGSVAIAPQPVLPVTPTGGPQPDRSAPVVSAFAASPATFAVSARATPLTAKVRRGTTFKFALSEPAAVAITIRRELAGLKSGKRCLTPSARLRRAILKKGGKRGLRRARCTRLKRMGVLRRAGAQGANTIAFSGRLGKRALGVARYRATLVATDTAGNRSRSVVAKFRIVSARRAS